MSDAASPARRHFSTLSYGKLDLPIPASAAPSMPLIVVDAFTASSHTIAQLADPPLCAALPPELRKRIAVAITRHLVAVLEGAAPNWFTRLRVVLSPERMAGFTVPTQARLRAAGVPASSARAPLVPLVASGIRTVPDLVCLLAMAAPLRPWRSSDWETVQTQRVTFHASRSTLSLSPPQRWRAPPTSRAYRFANNAVVYDDDVRLAWWLHQIEAHAPAPGLASPPGGVVDGEACLAFAEQRGSDALVSIVRAARAVLLNAPTMTVGEEIASISSAAGRVLRDAGRGSALLALRYGAAGHAASLAYCAEVFGVSRETVSQQLRLCRSVCTTRTYAPATRALHGLVASHGSVSCSPARAVARLLGPDQSVDGALLFAYEVLGLPLLS